jgi:hypothetical protein
VRIDHVVYAVADLDRAAARWDTEFGLASVPGGVHPGWGTANRIAPLGDAYLELLSIVDPATAAGTVLGQALSRLTADDDAWFSFCVADDDVEARAARLGLALERGSRTRPDGRIVAWRSAGIDDPRRPYDRPFFIRWDVPDLHPGATPAAHPNGATGIAAVEVTGDPDGVRAWLDGADLPIEVTPGPPAVVAVRLSTSGGEIRIT